MKPEPEKIVASIVAATDDGKLVSRIRMQKINYLLQQLDAPIDFTFSYYHYGPYSRELDKALEDAKAFQLIEEKQARRVSDGATYSIFQIPSDQLKTEDAIQEITTHGDLIQKLAKSKVTVLELAATAHWLSEKEKVEDWKSEIKRRKGRKTEGGRLESALKLLSELGLPPGAAEH